VTEDKILQFKLATEAEIQAIKDRVKLEIDDCVEFAENSPLPPASELYTDNYVQEDYPFIRD
jgi:pyruvate dehydrogenase E1 component alpha subunit